MKKSHEVLKKAFNKTGIKSVAKDLKLSAVLLYKWCEEYSRNDVDPDKGALNPLERVAQIYDKTGDVEMIRWLCERANGFFVDNLPVGKNPLDAHIFKNTQKIIKEFSETIEEISDCFNNDQTITLKEAQNIREEWEDLKRAGESFVIACESGKFIKKYKLTQ